MSVKTSTWVWNPQNCPVSGNRLVVMLALADMANDDGECYPGKPKLAIKLRLGERAVRAILDDLEKLGLIEITPRKRPDGSDTSNLYRICMGGVNQDSPGGESANTRGVNQDSPGGAQRFTRGVHSDSPPSIETSFKHQLNDRENSALTPFDLLIRKDEER